MPAIIVPYPIDVAKAPHSVSKESLHYGYLKHREKIHLK